jgi:putative peptidoglycan lipid II flippase
LAGTSLLLVYLMWAAQAFAWIDLRAESLTRIALLGGLLAGAAALYLGSVWAAGLNLRQFLRR